MATVRPISTFILAATIKDAPYLMSARTLEKSRIALIPSQDVRAIFDADRFQPYEHCHRPILVRGERRSVGWVIEKMAHQKPAHQHGILEDDVVLVWGKSPRIITGADILGRLLQGV